MYTKDTDVPDSIINTPEEHEILDNVPLVEIPQQIDDDSHVEFFECVKCGEYNIITTKMKKRRTTKVRHIKVNDVTWGSLKRFAVINNVTMDYALTMMLMAVKSKNISYMISERKLVDDNRSSNSKKRKALK